MPDINSHNSDCPIKFALSQIIKLAHSFYPSAVLLLLLLRNQLIVTTCAAEMVLLPRDATQSAALPWQVVCRPSVCP